MNTVILIGRLTKDVELRYTANEVPVATFTIAVNREYKNANGEYETDFINLVAFQQSAKLLSEYTHKGDLIGVKGRIQTRNYEDDKGKHYITEVLVEKITFLSQNKKEKVEEKKQKEDPYKEFGEIVENDNMELPF